MIATALEVRDHWSKGTTSLASGYSEAIVVLDWGYFGPFPSSTSIDCHNLLNNKVINAKHLEI